MVITTALVMGKKAPVLITEEQVKQMKLGAVIVDMAVEQGGNCELSELNKNVTKSCFSCFLSRCCAVSHEQIGG